MAILKTVEVPKERLAQFEKLMADNNFTLTEEQSEAIPVEVQVEMQRRLATFDERKSHTLDEMLDVLKSKGWSGKS